MYNINTIFNKAESEGQVTVVLDTFRDIEKIRTSLANKYIEKYGNKKKFIWEFTDKKQNNSILLMITNYDAYDINYRDMQKETDSNVNYKLTPWVLNNLLSDEMNNITIAPSKDISKCGGRDKYLQYMRSIIDQIVDYNYKLELIDSKFEDAKKSPVIKLTKISEK